MSDHVNSSRPFIHRGITETGIIIGYHDSLIPTWYRHVSLATKDLPVAGPEGFFFNSCVEQEGACLQLGS